VEASIRWYELLGLKVVDTMGDPVFWVRLHCEGDAIMLTGAEKPIDPDAQRVAFYLYSPDLVALREHLLANGVNASEIYYPEYMPSGEVRLRDPDQFYVFVGHWGKKEQENWEKRIAERAK
jgi:catechol 2,3-dioxygenase-like lactoylglutathione lyase family enzyme